MKQWWLISLVSLFSGFSLGEDFGEYLQEKVSDYHFQTLTYQFRFADSFQYVASENYDLEAVEDYANDNDPYANIILYYYYSDVKKHKKAEQASLRIFVQTTPGQEFLPLQNAMSLLAQSAPNSARAAAYLMVLKDEQGIDIDEGRLAFLRGKHTEHEISAQLERLKAEIEILSKKSLPKTVKWAAEPLHIQKRKEG